MRSVKDQNVALVAILCCAMGASMIRIDRRGKTEAACWFCMHILVCNTQLIDALPMNTCAIEYTQNPLTLSLAGFQFTAPNKRVYIFYFYFHFRCCYFVHFSFYVSIHFVYCVLICERSFRFDPIGIRICDAMSALFSLRFCSQW